MCRARRSPMTAGPRRVVPGSSSRLSARSLVQVRLPVRGYAAGWTGSRLVERMMLRSGQRWPIVRELFGLVVPEPCLTWLEAADHRVPGGHRVRASTASHGHDRRRLVDELVVGS